MNLVEQAKLLSAATGALDVEGKPLTFSIRSDGTGVGTAVIDAVNLLTGNLAMDVGVVLNQQPDRPTRGFRFLVEAVDAPGDLCDPPIDTDGDAQHLPDTHVNCRPGAAPRFRVRFANPEAPNHVPPNAADPRGGYNMRLDLIGDGTYVVDQVPVYIVPEELRAEPPVVRYPASANYDQTLGALACSGNDAPLWSTLHWSATMPAGTALRWEACSANDEQALARCTPRLLAEVRTGDACNLSSDCPGGSCAEDKRCRYVTGRACSSDDVCGDGGSCVERVCRWSEAPIDVRAVFGPEQQGRALMRVRATLSASAERAGLIRSLSESACRGDTSVGKIMRDLGLASSLHWAQAEVPIVKVQRLTLDGDVDFDVLARTLERLFEGRPPSGRAGGLARVTRAIELLIACPPTAAAQLVGALVFRHQLMLSYDACGNEIWTFREPPARC